MQEHWEKALKKTEIIRSRMKSLQTYSATYVSYVFLAESSLNVGDTVVRKGQVRVERPSLLLPPDNPQFDGFEFETVELRQKDFLNFLLIRGIHLESLKYNNVTSSLDIYEGRLQSAVDYYQEQMRKQEDIETGLFLGPEEIWQFSLLIYVCSQISRSAEADFSRLLEKYRKSNGI